MKYVRNHVASRCFLRCGGWYRDSRVFSIPGLSLKCCSRFKVVPIHRHNDQRHVLHTLIARILSQDAMIYTETISEPKMPRTGQVCQGQTQQACGLQGCCNTPDRFSPSSCTTSIWTNINRCLWKVLHILNASRPQSTPRSRFETSLLR